MIIQTYQIIIPQILTIIVGLEPKEEGEGIKFTPDYEEKESVFWCIFEELSNDGNGLVDYYKLQERLLSTGKFYAGDAVLMIEHIEKIGKIEQRVDYHIYRIKDSDSPNVQGGGKL